MDKYEDIYARFHECIDVIASDSYGIVYRTSVPNIAIKLAKKDDQILLDPSYNAKYQRLRLLPIPQGLHVALPRSILKDAAGYTLDLLLDMQSFSEAFASPAKELSKNAWVAATFAHDAKLKYSYLNYLSTGGAIRRLKAYIKAADILAKLHENGLVFCNLSPNNIFVSSDINNKAPEVWLIDADNLNFPDCIKDCLLQTKYCAPEVSSQGQFTFASDCYAFAIMLFEHLTQKHPFKGQASAKYNFGTLLHQGQLPWILDADDTSNQQALHFEPSSLFPKSLLHLFHRTFSKQGRTYPLTRPTMAEWLLELGKALDLTVKCPHCQMTYIVHQAQNPALCPFCKHPCPLLHIETFSTHQKTSELMHEFYTSIIDHETISIPTRAIGGLSSDHQNGCSLVLTKDTCTLSHINHNFTLSFQEADILHTINGSLEININALPFLLKSEDTRDGFATFLKIEVIR